jgi:hypothetical protein
MDNIKTTRILRSKKQKTEDFTINIKGLYTLDEKAFKILESISKTKTAWLTGTLIESYVAIQTESTLIIPSTTCSKMFNGDYTILSKVYFINYKNLILNFLFLRLTFLNLIMYVVQLWFYQTTGICFTLI